MKRKVIIDCDPGIDDALALILAIKSNELDILGITIVSGNVPALQGDKNAKRILKLLGKEEIKICWRGISFSKKVSYSRGYTWLGWPWRN